MTVGPALSTLLCAAALVCACGKSSSKKTDEAPVVVPDPKQAAAAHDARQWKQCAELWLAVAATTKGEAMVAPLYDAACCQAQGGEIDAAFATLDRAVVLGLQSLDLQQDKDLVPLHGDPRWQQLLSAIRAQAAKAEARVADKALRSELLALEKADKNVRDIALHTGDELAAMDIDAFDAKSTARMKEIVAQHGWPGKTLVGKDGAHAAWLLVQHSRDVAFQKLCLEKLELAVVRGEAQAVEHAYLYDRVAVNTGKPQRWGTQFRNDLTAYPIEDEAQVDQRRKAIGLPSMAEQQRLLRERDNLE